MEIVDIVLHVDILMPYINPGLKFYRFFEMLELENFYRVACIRIQCPPENQQWFCLEMHWAW